MISNKNELTRADIELVISAENPLMHQMYNLFGEIHTLYDFTNIGDDSKYVTLQHDKTGLIIAYTTEERLKSFDLNETSQHNIKTDSSCHAFNNDQIMISSGSKTLIRNESNIPGKDLPVSSFRIFDKSTGQIQPLNIGDIDLNNQPTESIAKLLSGKKVEMTNKSGISNLVGLNKTVTGWGISTAKQVYHEAGSSAEF